MSRGPPVPRSCQVGSQATGGRGVTGGVWSDERLKIQTEMRMHFRKFRVQCFLVSKPYQP